MEVEKAEEHLSASAIALEPSPSLETMFSAGLDSTTADQPPTAPAAGPAAAAGSAVEPVPDVDAHVPVEGPKKEQRASPNKTKVITSPCVTCGEGGDPRKQFTCNTCRKSYHYLCAGASVKGGEIRNCSPCQEELEADAGDRPKRLSQGRRRQELDKAKAEEWLDDPIMRGAGDAGGGGKEKRRRDDADRRERRKEDEREREARREREREVADRKSFKSKWRKEQIKVNGQIKRMRERQFPMDDLELLREDLVDLPAAPPATSVEELPEPFSAADFGSLLLCWDVMNQMRDFFNIAPFSLQDLRSALHFEGDCLLLAEIHCSLLRVLVEDSNAGGIDQDAGGKDWALLGSTSLDPLTWQHAIFRLINSDPYFSFVNENPLLQAAISDLAILPYASMSVSRKMAVLRLLVDSTFDTALLRDHLRRTFVSREEVLKRKVAAEKDEEKAAKQLRLEELERTRKRKQLEQDKLEQAMELREEVADGEEHAPELKTDVSDHDSEDDTAPGLSEAEQVARRLARDKRQRKLDSRNAEVLNKFDEQQRKRRWKLIAKEKQEEASAAISRAIKAKDILALKQAMQRGRDANLETGRGERRWRSAEMELAYSELERLELEDERSKEVQQALARKRKRDDAFDRELKSLVIRTEMVGRDRYFNKYWYFLGDAGHLYVEQRDVPNQDAPPLRERKELYSKSNEELAAEARAKLEPQLTRKASSRWLVYDTIDDVELLISSLDERGVREKDLKASLESLLVAMEGKMKRHIKADAVDAKDDMMDGPDPVIMRRASFEEPLHFLSYVPVSLVTSGAAVLPVGELQSNASLILLRSRLLELLSECRAKLRPVWPEMTAWEASIQEAKVAVDFQAALTTLETAVHLLLQPGDDNSTAVTEVDGVEGPDAYDAPSLWPTRYDRAQWLDRVAESLTLSGLAFEVDVLVGRCASQGVIESKAEKKAKARSSKPDRKQSKVPAAQDHVPAEDSDVCEICREPGELLCCETCPRVFHVKCVGLKRAPRGDWHCSKCAGDDEGTDGDGEATDAEEPGGCAVCGAGGASMACDDCDNQFHPKCVGLRRAAKDFTCSSCKKKSNKNKRKKRKTTKAVVYDEPGDDDKTVTDSGQPEEVCKNCLKPGELLLCDGCPGRYHLACVGIKVVPEGNWFCHNCEEEVCGKCKVGPLLIDDHLLCGDEGEGEAHRGCDRPFHLKCVGLKSVPDGDWFCSSCKK